MATRVARVHAVMIVFRYLCVAVLYFVYYLRIYVIGIKLIYLSRALGAITSHTTYTLP